MAKILVTGGSGFIGTHTVDLLVKHGHDVTIIDWNMQQWSKDLVGEHNCIEDDFVNSFLYGLDEFDAVIHFAASHVVPDSIDKSSDYYENNVIKTKDLLDDLVKHGVKNIVFSGSSSVYGNNGMGITLHEGIPINPQSPYASTKAITEIMLKDYDTSYGLRHVSLRYFNAAGADPEARFGYIQEPATHLVPVMCQHALDNKTIPFYGNDYNTPDGTCIRDYTHVVDLAEAHLKAVEYLINGGKSEVINVGGGVGASLLEMSSVLNSIQPTSYEFKERRKGDPDMLVADIRKAKTVLDWEPKKTHADIMQDALRWERVYRSQQE